MIGDVILDPATFHFLELLEQRKIQPLFMKYHPVGIGAGHNLAAELVDFLNGIDRHIAGTGNAADLAIQRVAPRLEHLFNEKGGAVAGRFGAYQGTAPDQPLTGQHAGLVAVGDAFVLAEHIADFPAPDADVAGRHVGVLTDVTIQLGHEALAKTHDFRIALALGIKVRTALAATDGHTGQSVLEDLLKAEEFDNPQIHGGMKTQAPLVRAQGTVKLDPEGAVDVHSILVVLPGYPENDLPLRLADPLDNFVIAEFRVFAQHRSQGFQNFANRLMEFDLPRIAGQNLLIDRRCFLVQLHCHGYSCCM